MQIRQYDAAPGTCRALGSSASAQR